MTRIQSVLRDGVFQYPTIKPITFQIGNNGSAIKLQISNIQRNDVINSYLIKWKADISILRQGGYVDFGELELELPETNIRHFSKAIKENEDRITNLLIDQIKRVAEHTTENKYIYYKLPGNISETPHKISFEIYDPLMEKIPFISKGHIQAPVPLPAEQRLFFNEALEPVS